MPTSSCGHENRDGATYCQNCGVRLALSCASCGANLPSGARFCDACGTPAADVSAMADPAGGSGPPTASGSAPVSDQTRETIEFLSRMAIFKHLRFEVLRVLAETIRVVSLPEGPVFMEKDRDHGLYIIRSGVAKVTKSAEGSDAEAVLAIIRDGDSFGEIGLIDGLPRSADVVAMRSMECYYLGRDVFLQTLETYPELARGMLQSLAGMVRNADEWVARAI